MKKLLYICLLLGIQQIQAQNPNSYATLSYSHPTKYTYIYRVGSKPITHDEFMGYLNSFPDSAYHLKKYKDQTKYMFVFAGSLLLDAMIPSPVRVPVGLVCVTGVLVEAISASRHFRKSIELYNKHVTARLKTYN